jgi:hypothetical protein
MVAAFALLASPPICGVTSSSAIDVERRFRIAGSKRLVQAAQQEVRRQAQEDKRKRELLESLPKLEKRLQELRAAAEKKH